jgi:pentatricopeptide repeat protein
MDPAYLALLLKHNNHEQCENIIDSVLVNYDPVPAPLLMEMARYHTTFGDADRSLEILAKLPAKDMDQVRSKLRDQALFLIRLDTVEHTGERVNFNILPKLLKLGVPLTDREHNAVIERAIALEVPDVAWEVFHYMEENKIVVNARSHLVLLRNCFQREDLPGLNEIMSAIYRREDLYQDPYLVAYTMNIVRVVCYTERKLSPDQSFSHMLAIYDRAYDRGPLAKFGLTSVTPSTEGKMPLPQPQPDQLGFTLWAYILVQLDEYPVSRLWQWFVYLVRKGDPEICALAKLDVLYNGVILFYARRASTLLKALAVLEQMIQIGLCTPTEHTWSLMLCGFLRHGQHQAAEKVYQTMQARNVRFDPRGWDFLLREHGKTAFAAQIKEVLDERRMPAGIEVPANLPMDGAEAENKRPADWKVVQLAGARIWADEA